MKATVFVRLKGEVLDPQGDAVKRAMHSLGFEGVTVDADRVMVVVTARDPLGTVDQDTVGWVFLGR